MMKATTVVLLPEACKRWLRPGRAAHHHTSALLISFSPSSLQRAALRCVQCRLTSKRLDKHIDTLISILVPSSREKVQSIFQIEIIMTVKVTSDEIVDLGFTESMQVLEFVHC